MFDANKNLPDSKYKMINEGVRLLDDGTFGFDYTLNLPTDIVNLHYPKIALTQSKISNRVYWFGYEFNPDADSKTRTEFINYLKGTNTDSTKITANEVIQFIELPLGALHEKINLYKLDCFVYPNSKRSKLVQTMIEVILSMTAHGLNYLPIELVKQASTEVQFDWEAFKLKHSQYTKGDFKNVYDYVNNVLLPKIHDLDYFSLAKNVKPKYRPYIKNYLTFKNPEDKEVMTKLEGKNILILDDINTSGSTINEILRVIGEINETCNIYIFTLIGKADRDGGVISYV